jgi:hypothetical protein
LHVLEDLRDLVEQPKDKENIIKKLTELDNEYRTLVKEGNDMTNRLMVDTDEAYRKCSF